MFALRPAGVNWDRLAGIGWRDRRATTTSHPAVRLIRATIATGADFDHTG